MHHENRMCPISNACHPSLAHTHTHTLTDTLTHTHTHTLWLQTHASDQLQPRVLGTMARTRAVSNPVPAGNRSLEPDPATYPLITRLLLRLNIFDEEYDVVRGGEGMGYGCGDVRLRLCPRRVAHTERERRNRQTDRQTDTHTHTHTHITASCL